MGLLVGQADQIGVLGMLVKLVKDACAGVGVKRAYG
jgi:hypothetical protein